jgi:hypothetical protein
MSLPKAWKTRAFQAFYAANGSVATVCGCLPGIDAISGTSAMGAGRGLALKR